MSISKTAPASLLLVHGAGSGPEIYKDWIASFTRIKVAAIDLHQGINVACASMMDYTDRVVSIGSSMEKPLALVGWSMGGLAVMQAARRLQPHSLILLEPS